MDCEKCGAPMRWEGSLRSGSMVCPRCAICDEPVYDLPAAQRESMADAIHESMKRMQDIKQLDIYRKMLESANPAPDPVYEPADQWVTLQCGNCSNECSCLSSIDPAALACPFCCKNGFLRRV